MVAFMFLKGSKVLSSKSKFPLMTQLVLKNLNWTNETEIKGTKYKTKKKSPAFKVLIKSIFAFLPFFLHERLFETTHK